MSAVTDHVASVSRRLAVVALALGAFAQLAQILVFREIMAICHGTEILFGVVLAANLGWTAAGTALATGLMPKAAAGWRSIRGLLAALASVNGCLMIAEILVARALAGWGTQAAGQTISLGHAVLLTLLVTCPVAMISGCEFALALRAASVESFAAIYRAESWGAVLAGLGFTFLLVQIATLIPGVIVAIPAAIVAGAALAVTVVLALRPLPVWSKAVLTSGCVLLASLACLPLDATSHRRCWHSLLPGYELLEIRDTPYGRVAALAQPGGRQISIFHNGALVTTLEPTARTHESRPFADLCACLHPKPRTALLIGGTLDQLPRELLRHGLERIDAVELDPALFELAHRYTEPAELPPAIQLVTADGRALVHRAATGSYDLIVVSMGEPDTATVNRYYTVEFFEQCRRCLSDDGLLILTLPSYGSGAEYMGEALRGRTATVWRTLRVVFANVRAAPVHGFLFVATRHHDVLTLDPAALAQRLATRPAAARYVTLRIGSHEETMPIAPQDYFEGLFGGVLIVREDLDGGTHQQQIDALEALLEGTDARTNWDTYSTAVTQSLLLSSELRGGGDWGKGLIACGPWSLVLSLGGFLAASCIVLRAQREPRLTWPASAALLMAALVTGMFGMAVPIALLTAYQNIRGCVYQEVGALMAWFMVGLAIGARSRQSHDRSRRQAIFGLLGMLLFASMMLGAVRLLSSLPSTAMVVAIFWGMVVVAGFLDGLMLSSLVACGSSVHNQSWSGQVYSLDLVGAAVGALVCGAVWIPAFGIAGTMLALAGLIVVSLLSLFPVCFVLANFRR